ncbi:MAG: minichromosome maintenance protein MCM [Deltaproteobacteria bacterium]|nr:minichromosome maintenance protein MCM [Deltaproteobacteria bacterium]
MDAPGINLTDHVGWWSNFLKHQCREQISAIRQEYPFLRSLEIDYYTLLKAGKGGIEQTDRLHKNPDLVIEDAKNAIRQYNLIFTADEKDNVDLINIRFIKFPKKILIREINAKHINQMVSIECTAKKSTEIRPRVVKAVFRCLQCSTITPSYKQGYNKFQEPYRPCTQCEKNTKMELVDHLSTFINTQKTRVQEPPETLKRGQQPATIDLDVTDDLCLTKNQVYPGDRVIVNGIVKSFQRTYQGAKSPYFTTYLEVNSFEKFTDDYEEIHISDEDIQEIEQIIKSETLRIDVIKSIAPSIFGHENIKEAIALQLFSGVPKDQDDGTTLRGDIHILCCMDPGVGKSQLLRYVAQLSPHGVYASGQGSSQAGLTASVLKDDFGDGSYTAEAGAMVLANNGILALDEADKMRDDDRKSIHTAMEQQIITIHKAGINMDLPARCAILAAANPKDGRFDIFRPIADQVKFDPAMLSRFDLIFVMDDRPDEINDRQIATHIAKNHKAGALKAAGIGGSDIYGATPVIPTELMRKYIAHARKSIPILSDEAMEVIVDYYASTRQINGGKENAPVPITARAAEAAIRLSEACARMHLSETVTADHARHVISLIDCCLKRLIWDSKSQNYDIDRMVSPVPTAGRNALGIIKETIHELSPDNLFISEEKLYESVSKQGIDKLTRCH